MKHWSIFKQGVEWYIHNCRSLALYEVGSENWNKYFELNVSRIESWAKTLYEKGGHPQLDNRISYYITNAQHEISQNLVNNTTRELTIKKIHREFQELTKSLDKIEHNWTLHHVKHEARFDHSILRYLDSIHEFHRWFLLETELYIQAGRELYLQNNGELIESYDTQHQYKEPMSKLDLLTTVRIKKAVSQINGTNVSKVYNQRFNRFLYDHSDNVEINGVLTNDKIKRAMMTFNGMDGKPNIKTATMDGMKDGIPITELDFIEYELSYLTTEGITDFTLKKKVNVYLNHLTERKTVLESTPQNHIQSLSYPVDIFRDSNAHSLFLYFVDKYALDKKVIEFSHIFHWMKENDYIKKNTGNKFKAYILREGHLSSFSRIADYDPKERTTLNELRKVFTQEKSSTD